MSPEFRRGNIRHSAAQPADARVSQAGPSASEMMFAQPRFIAAPLQSGGKFEQLPAHGFFFQSR